MRGNRYLAAVDEALLADPTATNREIAERAGATAITVWAHRKALGLPRSPRDEVRRCDARAAWGPFDGNRTTPFPASTMRADVRARFLSHVEIVDDETSCWIWNGRRHAMGYGMFCDGRDRRAHRVSWEIANGRSVPAGLVVRHRCDNPPCVRPDHLLVGTRRDNADDMVERGRGRTTPRFGDAHHASKIADADVPILRAAFAGGAEPAALAERFDVSVGMVWRIVRRQSHAHIDDGIPAAPRGVLRWERHRAKWAAIREARRSAA